MHEGLVDLPAKELIQIVLQISLLLRSFALSDASEKERSRYINCKIITDGGKRLPMAFNRGRKGSLLSSRKIKVARKTLPGAWPNAIRGENCRWTSFSSKYFLYCVSRAIWTARRREALDTQLRYNVNLITTHLRWSAASLLCYRTLESQFIFVRICGTNSTLTAYFSLCLYSKYRPSLMSRQWLLFLLGLSVLALVHLRSPLKLSVTIRL